MPGRIVALLAVLSLPYFALAPGAAQDKAKPRLCFELFADERQLWRFEAIDPAKPVKDGVPWVACSAVELESAPVGCVLSFKDAALTLDAGVITASNISFQVAPGVHPMRTLHLSKDRKYQFKSKEAERKFREAYDK